MGWASRANPRTKWTETDWLYYKVYDHAMAEDAERTLAKMARKSVWQRFRDAFRRLFGW